MENNTPHSYQLRAEQIKRDHVFRSGVTGKFRQPTRPSEAEVAILRRISRGHLQVTQGMEDGKPATFYTYDDGTPVSRIGKHGFTNLTLSRFINNGWIVGVEGESMFDGPPQRYVVPKR